MFARIEEVIKALAVKLKELEGNSTLSEQVAQMSEGHLKKQLPWLFKD
jgi:hypothetical protein